MGGVFMRRPLAAWWWALPQGQRHFAHQRYNDFRGTFKSLDDNEGCLHSESPRCEGPRSVRSPNQRENPSHDRQRTVRPVFCTEEMNVGVRGVTVIAIVASGVTRKTQPSLVPQLVRGGGA